MKKEALYVYYFTTQNNYECCFDFIFIVDSFFFQEEWCHTIKDEKALVKYI